MYNLMAVRTADDTDGRLYPLIGSGAYPVELEPIDGQVTSFTCKGIRLSELAGDKFNPVVELKDSVVQVYITDARVIFAVEKWNKGSRYWGMGLGATVALVSNSVNAVREARARRGTLLLGHIRYQWLSHVGWMPKAGWGSQQQLRLGVASKLEDGSARRLFVDIAPPASQSLPVLAAQTARRAGAFWLKHGPLEEADQATRDGFAKLARADALAAPAPKKFAMHTVPIALPARESNALWGMA